MSYPILGWSAFPDDSGEVTPETVDQAGFTEANGLAWRFSDEGNHHIRGRERIRGAVGDNPVARLTWFATPTSGAVRWRFSYRVVGASYDIDPDEEQVSETATVSGVARNNVLTEFPITAANISDGDEIVWELARLADEGADTLSGDAIVGSLELDLD